jgi:hypothetical protein
MSSRHSLAEGLIYASLGFGTVFADGVAMGRCVTNPDLRSCDRQTALPLLALPDELPPQPGPTTTFLMAGVTQGSTAVFTGTGVR